MRHFFFLLALATLLARSAIAQTIRIATWQVSDLPMPLEGAKTPQVDPARLDEIAAALSTADADVIVLYGMPDSESARKVADQMKPQKYSVAVHSLFRHNWPKGPIVGQPFCILSRKQKMAARSIDWGTTGRIELPGGFAFATFRHGTAALCIYVTELPGSLTNFVSQADGSFYARKRNYAAQYLTHHANWVASTYTNQLFATYITGDFNLSPHPPVKDDGAKLLEQAGFKSASPGTAQDKSASAIIDGLNFDWVLNSIFTRGVEFMATRQIAKPSPERPLVTCDLTLKPPSAASVLPTALKPPPKKAQTETVTPAPTVPAVQPSVVAAAPAPAQEFVIDRRWIWIGAAAVAGIVLAIGFLRSRSRRRRNVSMSLGRRANDAMFVELAQSSVTPKEPALGIGEVAGFSGPTTATSNAQNAPWLAQSVRERAGTEPTAEARAGLIPHLSRLMREKLFVWLSSQRSQLLDSHETGTKQVLSLEERLEKIQGRFQHRLISQEQRIAELEKDVQTKEKIIRSFHQQQSDSDDSSNR